jgi:hypothetical protein
MHLRLVRDPAPPKKVSRPAKVVQLEARRKARLEQALQERPRHRPAA